MRQFTATVVESYADENGVMVVHFDDGGGHYLQLQAPEADDPAEWEAGYGNVYVEVDDQLHSGFNCFSLAELARDRFRLALARDADLVREVREVVVTFDLDAAAFDALRQCLGRVFRAYPGYRPAPDT